MGSVQNLQETPAFSKLKELAGDARLCMFNTRLCGAPFHTRPMAIQLVEEDGTMWFFSAADSTANQDIARDNRVQLIYSNRSAAEFLTVYGTAKIVVDRVKAKKLWNVSPATWFHGGPEDPNLTLLRFTPMEGYYWDTMHNKMTQSMRIVVGAIKRKMMDDGLDGTLTVN